ncbi:putative stress-responsive nuclear envelope protein [Geosmithia morbida]|uniref:Stress-responsive nuclear envelope protein n=1 Tax=Geosmithia morbida TaxID=1094350 RepID=A0A9P4YUN6_9HYPO|nr:putative stress-responsive nuclear envelope protein [Geosmithia morbida]KAF4122380.1 putative stress-responsive nuclear envelope protein [Geosmithia morbida]
MKHLSIILPVALTAFATASSSWFPGSRDIPVYNKWHETELERWLSDNNIPYPTPADRKDLESLVGKNWEDYVVKPYKKWDTAELSSFLQNKGQDAVHEAQESRENLVHLARSNWYETEDNTLKAWDNVKDWIFDTWGQSQLKAFADKHDIPVPQPRPRDAILQRLRLNYENIAKRLGETTSYPGNWLYDSWTESDLKEWLDTHGFPSPQPSSRDKLIASVRRNSRLAYLKAQAQAASATKSAQAAYSTLTDIIIDTWGESELKKFCDKNGIPVPQGTKVNELRAIVRKNRAEILGDTAGAHAAAAFGAATSSAGNQYAKASDSASLAARNSFDKATETWSESRLKAYLDARGVPVPQTSKLDDLRALVRKNSHKASTGWSAWTFDDLTYNNLKDYLEKNGDAAAKNIAAKKDVTHKELASAANSAYSSASTAGGSSYESATNYFVQTTEAAKTDVFDKWSHSELKAYLDSYGIVTPQGNKLDELKAEARKQATYFKYGTTSPSETIFAKLEGAVVGGWKWVSKQLELGSTAAKEEAAGVEKEAEIKASKAKNEL